MLRALVRSSSPALRRWRSRPSRRPQMPLLAMAVASGLLFAMPTARNDAGLASPRLFDDEYDIVYSRALGSGAFGMVMQCIRKMDQTLSAVKVIADCYEEATRERTALGCVQMAGGHDNIIHLNDHYTHDGFHYIVMEFVDGMTLFDFVHQRTRLDELAARHILAQVASALMFMHNHGMVHCDLKPDNIMIQSSDDNRVHVKLIDFGSTTIPNPQACSMPLKRAITLSSIPQSGTKSYWSPEMLGDKHAKVMPKMDMWSLGCILYIMLTGSHPFDPKGNLTEAEILHNVRHCSVDFNQPIWQSVSPQLQAIVAGLLDKDPTSRLSAVDLVEKLKVPESAVNNGDEAEYDDDVNEEEEDLHEVDNLVVDDNDKNEMEMPKDTMEIEKKHYTVQEQRAVIRKIHESNQILKQELAIEWREAKSMMGAAKQEKLKRLQKQSTSFTHKIEQEKRTIAKLDAAIVHHNNELQRIRDEFVKSEKLESAAAASRRVRALENRLEISLVKKNEVDSMNKHLRQQIDKARRDRVVFDGIYKKLERETYEYASRLELANAELIKSIAGKDQIDKEVQELQAIVEAEQQSYEKEFKELRLLIASSTHEAAEQARAIELAPETEIVSGQLSPDEELSLHHTSAQSSWKIAYDKAIASASSAEAIKYHQLFEHIFTETGVPDAEHLTQEIQRKDEENFKTFKHVEGLHKEIDDLRVELEKTTAALDAYKQQEGIGASVLDKTHLRAMSAKLHAIEEKNSQMDIEYDETCVRLGRVKATIHSIFTVLHQTTDKAGQKANSGVSLTDITDSNMLEYLQIIEKCIIAQLHNSHSSGNGLEQMWPHVLPEAKPHANAKKMKQNIDPPTLSLAELSVSPSKLSSPSARSNGSSCASGRYLDATEEDERALTYDELKECAEATFQRPRGRRRDN